MISKLKYRIYILIVPKEQITNHRSVDNRYDCSVLAVAQVVIDLVITGPNRAGLHHTSFGSQGRLRMSCTVIYLAS